VPATVPGIVPERSYSLPRSNGLNAAQPASQDAQSGDAFYPDRLVHFRLLYTRRGYVEVVAGRPSAANPDQIELLAWRRESYDEDKASGKPRTRSWLLVDPERPETLQALERRVEKLAQLYGNVYTSVAQYGDASRRSPQPSRVVLVEDSPDPGTLPLAPSWAMQTSPRSWHAYYLLDRELLPYERQRLARGLARVFGGDPSGVDAEQLTRPPATRNTKAKYGPNGFAVQLVPCGNTIYMVEQLEALFSCTQAQSAEQHERTTNWASYRDQLDTAQVEDYLHRIGAFLKDDRLPRRLSEKARGFWRSTLLWEDTSRARWALALSLLRHRYPLTLATALLYHLTFNHSKGGSWSLDDAAACVIQHAQLLGERYQPEAERVVGEGETRAPVIATAPDRPRKRGRPLGSTGARRAALQRLLTRRWEDDADPLTGQLIYQAEELAELLGISTRALRGYLQELAAEGKIERGQQGGPGGRPWLRLLPAFWVAEKSNGRSAEAVLIWVEEKSAVAAREEAGPAAVEQAVEASLPQAARVEPIWVAEKIAEDAAESTRGWVESSAPIQGERTSERGDQNGQCEEKQHTAPATPAPLPAVAPAQEAAACSPGQPNAREAVAEALAAITSRKRTRKAVWTYVSRLYGPCWSPEAIDFHRRALLASEPYDEERRRLAGLGDAELYGALRASQRYVMRREEGALSAWHRWRITAALDELRRRKLPIDAPAERKEHTRRAAELEYQLARERSRPRPTVAEQQASWNEVLDREADELFEELEWARVRGELPKAQGLVLHRALLQQPGTAGGVCSTQQREPSSPEASALITRLHARKEQQAHTATAQAYRVARDRSSCIDLDDTV
jgi:hypothetical protein